MIEIIDIRNNKQNPLFDKLTARSQMDVADVQTRVEEIVNAVRTSGDKALIQFTSKFDKVELNVNSIRVTDDEFDKAYNVIDKELLEVIRKAKANIEAFHAKQKENSWITPEPDGVILGQIYRALQCVGVYVPGGTAPLPSSVLMNVIPAKVAGVEKIVMCTPPTKDGSVNSTILVAAKEAGVNEIYKVGGAQAIAAMAFGTETISKVDKITGPGNIYVNTAKRMVFGYCDIDMFAGPSEIMVIADNTANPSYVAADLLSQAEHDALAASILVTDSIEFAEEVKEQISVQFQKLERKEIVAKSLSSYGAAVIVNSMDEAVKVANMVAPEHLEICTNNAFELIGDVKNAGAIFLGNYSPEPLGDYFAGPNHVLPTSGTARFFSPLNVGDFIKKTSIISYSKKALEKSHKDIIKFAEAEGLGAHANAIRIRF